MKSRKYMTNLFYRFADGRYVLPSADGEGAAAAGGGGEGAQTGATAFLASLPEPIRGHDAFKDVKDVGELATRYHGAVTKPFAIPEKYTTANPALKDLKSLDAVMDSLVNAQKLVGLDKSRVAVIPKDASDTAGMDALYKALGRPDKADGYQIGKRADGSEYSAEDKAFHQALLPLLHKAGVTQTQFDALRPEWDTLIQTMSAEQDKQLADGKAAAEQTLRREWGADFDANAKLAEDALRHYCTELKLGDDILKELNKTNIGNNPALAKLLVHLGKGLQEDGLLGKHSGGGGGVDAESAKAKIAELEKAFRKNQQFKDKGAPGRAEALAAIAELYQIAYPTEQA